jgi:hypothetical protein
MDLLLTSRARQAIRLGAAAAGLAILIVAAPQAVAQVHIQGKLNLKGVSTPHGNTGLKQYTHIWAFAPPNGTGGAEDNAKFVNNVLMPNGTIDGVSILLAWNSIEISAPTSTPCSPPSDVCQPDPGVLGMYHTYNWSTYDSVPPMTATPVYQWVAMSGKKVNILVTGEASGTTNPITPHYVTSSAWFDLFNPQTQDVINAVKDCTDVPWTGTVPSTGVSIVGSTVKVTDTTSCCDYPPPSTSQDSLVQDQDLVWVNANPAVCGTGGGGANVTVTSSSTFTYPLPVGCTSITSATYISAAQSWAVPYEYPYKNALKSFWAAVVAHYGPNFTLTVSGMQTNYFPKLNYFRFGGSVGSEWYPYCVNNGVSDGLESLPSPYTYSKNQSLCPVGDTCTPWLSYYQEMGNYLQSLGPPFQIIHSINAAESSPVDYTYGDAEAAYAVTWANRFGARDGFGSQGLSVQDQINCVSGGCPSPGPPNSASDWYPMFQKYGPSSTTSSGGPLELQPIALSDETNTTCSPTHCLASTTSGDLRVFLPFAVTAGGTDFEIYWRDLSLAYDINNYCHLNPSPPCAVATSASLGGWLSDRTLQHTFFQDVGQGGGMYCTGSGYQGGSTGNCEYQSKTDAAHGQH